MAPWLAARGHSVSLVTWDEGQPQGLEVEGVRVLKLCGPRDGWPGLRFFHPRWTSLNRVLGMADADVYYHNCAEYVTGQVALWCRRHARGFVYSAAAEADCDARLPLLRKRRERVLYRYGLGHADRILVQTRRQQRLLREGFGREAQVVAMPCPEPPSYAPPDPPGTGEIHVLWLGRICEEKRPERLLELARSCPELAFDLVGPAEPGPYARGILEAAGALPNVWIHGPASREQVWGLYRRAACLCSTSANEGFPNTFLEAWSHGLPVVSTFDPDDLIARKALGVAAAPTTLAASLRELLASPQRWRACSTNARRHYVENHRLEEAMAPFERIFLDVAAERAAAREARAAQFGIARSNAPR